MIQGTKASLNIERMTLLWTAALVGLLAVGMLITVGGMLTVMGGRACEADFSSSDCAALLHAYAPWEQSAQFLIGLLWVLPTGLGALLGVAVTAGEIEQRTAQVSWALARSRTRWLLLRAIPVAITLVGVLIVAAAFAEAVTRGRLITHDAGFHDYQLRSLLVPARGLLALAIGLTVGILIGRTLPALLVALLFSIAVTAGLMVVVQAWQMASATFIAMDAPALDGGTYPLIVIRSGVSSASGEGIPVIPATDFWVWVIRETGLLVAAAVAASLMAISVVQRRSP